MNSYSYLYSSVVWQSTTTTHVVPSHPPHHRPQFCTPGNFLLVFYSHSLPFAFASPAPTTYWPACSHLSLFPSHTLSSHPSHPNFISFPSSLQPPLRHLLRVPWSSVSSPKFELFIPSTLPTRYSPVNRIQSRIAPRPKRNFHWSSILSNQGQNHQRNLSNTPAVPSRHGQQLCGESPSPLKSYCKFAEAFCDAYCQSWARLGCALTQPPSAFLRLGHFS